MKRAAIYFSWEGRGYDSDDIISDIESVTNFFLEQAVHGNIAGPVNGHQVDCGVMFVADAEKKSVMDGFEGTEEEVQEEIRRMLREKGES